MIRLLFPLLAIAGFVIWIYALVDAIKVPDDSMYQSGNKLIWVIVILLAQIVGALIYLAAGKPIRAGTRRRPPQTPGDDLI